MELDRRLAALGSVALASLALAAGCGSDDGGSSPEPGTGPGSAEGTPAQAAAAGKAVFQDDGCANCHTLAAAGADGEVGPNLDRLRPSVAEVESQVRSGGGGMPAFAGQLSEDEIRSVAEFVSRSAGTR